jgi:TPR repeat protein
VAEARNNALKRAQANDPLALRQMGTIRHDGGDVGGAFEYWTKAAALGDADAHHQLPCLYINGEGVQKDMKKAVYQAEKAAIGDMPWHGIIWDTTRGETVGLREQLSISSLPPILDMTIHCKC